MPRRLYRSRKETMIGGVAGGLGEYFQIDPVLVRLLFVLAVFLEGVGILAYVIMWIVVPKEPETATPPPTPGSDTDEETQDEEMYNAQDMEKKEEQKKNRTITGGIILIVLGFFFLADNFLPGFSFSSYWPLLLIVIGGWLLYTAIRKQTVGPKV
ncbi:MAG: hypothetical protein CL946_12865 [Ectothiorhodospiraceae bacterium]|nr:hypothetical protein [Ectothiorhodospiraceae bacterium]